MIVPPDWQLPESLRFCLSPRLGNEALFASHSLNIIAALFLPLSAIAGVFGMNFTGGLDGKNPLFFWLVLVVGVLLGAAMVLWVLGKSPKAER